MQWYKSDKQLIENLLIDYFERFILKNAEIPEQNILNATKYAILNGGKRIRPILGLLCFDLGFDDGLKISRQEAAKILLSLEFLHGYSLVHDDLPCMDNDELRRGKPTVWKQYGEDLGVLVGDALNTLAFENLAKVAPPQMVRELVLILAELSGINGMIGGQTRDIYFEKLAKNLDDKTNKYNLTNLIETHHKKTGCLLIAAAKMGCVLGRIYGKDRKLVETFTQKIGLAFQVKDDLLDIEGNEQLVGKKLTKDQNKGFISLLDVQKTREILNKLIQESIEIAQQLKSEKLIELAKYIEKRNT
jgi:geranylgeranyl pyrophosphate synthase